MPVEDVAIAAHAEVLRSDARALADCAERLREVRARLEADDIAPPWLRAAVDAHIAACLTAVADLDAAAARLERPVRAPRGRRGRP